ncbi:MAG: STAS domain-containing protein, partial [Clostridia bacterium]|nr:STAS domain-containing protein [Clostridia bacterium]
GQLVKDIIAGIIVAIIALPLSIALAIASGVGPEMGLYTAIVAGFLISFFGGSPVQIAGPTAAFATIVAGIVAVNGVGGLALATVMAGVILIIMGICRFGALIKYIPYTITTGFTAGIAVTILVGQLKDFFGVTYMHGEAPIETLEKVEALVHNFGTANVWSVVIGAVCLIILFLFPKITDKIPASLVAVVVGVGAFFLLGDKVVTIGDLYPDINGGLPKFTAPEFSLSNVKALLPDAFTIAILAAIESLLACVVADGMVGSKHRSNTELIAQGIGNVGSALFGGIPATGAIARTAANIKNGGRTPVSGMVHALVLLLVMIVLMPYAKMIPMATIAAILIHVAYNMSQWKPFTRLVKTAPKSDVLVLVITFVLTVVFDLVVAIEFGLIVTAALFLKRMGDETTVEKWTEAKNEREKAIPAGVSVYELTGALFFAATDRIKNIVTNEDTKCVVLRMRSVTALDATAVKTLEELVGGCNKKGVAIVLSHVAKQPMSVLKKAGLDNLIGEGNICANIDEALERAAQIAK